MAKGAAASQLGKVFTPPWLVDKMVEKLFAGKPPTRDSKVLDAGCGMGAFIDGILRWCRGRGVPIPQITGVEVDYVFVEACREKYKALPSVRIVRRDFLLEFEEGGFDYIISNPPYISIEYLDVEKREAYKRRFKTAYGRFDTYMLFFERALELLAPGGRLVFVTPEKYMYTLSARPLRKLLSNYYVREVELVDERAFGEIIAYPAVTVVDKVEATGPTRIILRDGSSLLIQVPRDGSPWLPLAFRSKLALEPVSGPPLKSIVDRVSCGVATGRDEVFVVERRRLPPHLEKYSWPTVSGRELSRFEPGTAIDPNSLEYVMLVPYDSEGRLLPEEEIQPLLSYLARFKPELEKRYCVVEGGKKWYAFHEDPPMRDLLKPKILCKDVVKEPAFWADLTGRVIPRHSVYYIVPKDPAVIPALLEYLNSYEVKLWLMAHAQRAANGFIRLQTSVLEKLPLKEEVIIKNIASVGLYRWL